MGKIAREKIRKEKRKKKNNWETREKEKIMKERDERRHKIEKQFGREKEGKKREGW